VSITAHRTVLTVTPAATDARVTYMKPPMVGVVLDPISQWLIVSEK